jgi:hypothetical protein
MLSASTAIPPVGRFADISDPQCRRSGRRAGHSATTLAADSASGMTSISFYSLAIGVRWPVTAPKMAVGALVTATTPGTAGSEELLQVVLCHARGAAQASPLRALPPVDSDE